LIGKALAGITALIALGAAATVAVVAAAFALYWVLIPSLGQAGAAAIVAGVFALIVAFGVLVAASKSASHGHHDSHAGHGGDADFDLVGKIFEIAREKPLWAAGAAVAAGLLAFRNPALVATIVAAFMDRPTPRS
jgi:hypothetical protein